MSAILLTAQAATAQNFGPPIHHGNDHYQTMRLDSQLSQSMLGTQRIISQVHNEHKRLEQLSRSATSTYWPSERSDQPWFSDDWRLGLNDRQLQKASRIRARQLDRYGRWFELRGDRESALICYREAIKVSPETTVPSRARVKFLTGE